ncbi:MAG: type II toxin-antitoxin system RelE/ParE family toxin [Gammaproteobacteria bacterium]
MQAREDLLEAAQFYQAYASTEFVQALFTEFERSVNLLLQYPALGSLWRSGRRRLLMRRFPYSLIYRIAGEEIRVLAVAHHSRRPGYWRGRK